MTTQTTRCCIVGGGPAGVMLGFLLGRAGVPVVVLEKHADFFRDFRGDTIHPSTLELMHELGMLDAFLKLPHQEVRTITARFFGRVLAFADFSHLPTRCKFIAFVPQWDFLNFIAGNARRYSTFELKMHAEATDLIVEGERVVGVRAMTPEGPLDIRADLVVGCDGRHSLVREKAGLAVEELGAPMDVLWFRLSRKPGDPPESLANFAAGHIVVMFDRADYWQCAFVIPKGSLDSWRARGIEALRAEIVSIVPSFRDRAGELADWSHVSLLTVSVNRLTCWHRPGLLCIGDAAHAMSPIGGVGVNLAIQDAVAAANILADPLYRPEDVDPLLAKVQERRAWPTRVTQRIQVVAQNTVISEVLGSKAMSKPPLPLRLFNRFPLLRRIPARVVGLGVRPEHIATPERGPPAD